MTKLPALLLALSGCVTEAVPVEEPGGRGAPTVHVDTPDLVVEPTMVALVADMCDEPVYAGTSWVATTADHFTLSFLPGTAADNDQDPIADRLERAYANIRGALGITAEPQLLVNLSPSRNAAYHHNRGFGRAWPADGHYDVIYTGADDSYEMRRYGQLLTVMLDYELDSAQRYRIPFLSVGVAELLDQSGRDLHTAYAQQLAAGVESRVHIAELDSKDVIGRNAGRSGSFVQFMVDRYGMAMFLDIYKATAITWQPSYGCNWHASYGCISTPDELTDMLDGVLEAQTGERWAAIQPEWKAAVSTALALMPSVMPAQPTAEIENLLRVMDHAITTDDAAEYRSTMEGFYCNGGGEAMRTATAERAVLAFGKTQTQLLALYDTGIKNFSTARAFVMRSDDGGVPSFHTLLLEHVPVGWRVAWGPDWY